MWKHWVANCQLNCILFWTAPFNELSHALLRRKQFENDLLTSLTATKKMNANQISIICETVLGVKLQHPATALHWPIRVASPIDMTIHSSNFIQINAHLISNLHNYRRVNVISTLPKYQLAIQFESKPRTVQYSRPFIRIPYLPVSWYRYL